eukprot:6147159-Alexandrium_andersonii.AAC.1
MPSCLCVWGEGGASLPAHLRDGGHARRGRGSSLPLTSIVGGSWGATVGQHSSIAVGRPWNAHAGHCECCLLYTSPSPRD